MADTGNYQRRLEGSSVPIRGRRGNPNTLRQFHNEAIRMNYLRANDPTTQPILHPQHRTYADAARFRPSLSSDTINVQHQSISHAQHPNYTDTVTQKRTTKSRAISTDTVTDTSRLTYAQVLVNTKPPESKSSKDHREPTIEASHPETILRPSDRSTRAETGLDALQHKAPQDSTKNVYEDGIPRSSFLSIQQIHGKDIEYILNLMRTLPLEFDVKINTLNYGTSLLGFEFTWHDSQNKYWRMYVHSPNENAPLGSNSSKNWIVRVKRGHEYMDLSGNFHSSKFADQGHRSSKNAIINATHIPIKRPNPYIPPFGRWREPLPITENPPIKDDELQIRSKGPY